jgi:hypothetical protein
MAVVGNRPAVETGSISPLGPHAGMDETLLWNWAFDASGFNLIK